VVTWDTGETVRIPISLDGSSFSVLFLSSLIAVLGGGVAYGRPHSDLQIRRGMIVGELTDGCSIRLNTSSEARLSIFRMKDVLIKNFAVKVDARRFGNETVDLRLWPTCRGSILGSDSNLMMACENRGVRQKRISLK